MAVECTGRNVEVTDEGDRRIYRWTHSHTKDDDQAAKGKKKAAKPDDEIPSVQLTTYKSWEELGAWYGALPSTTAGRRRIPRKLLRRKTFYARVREDASWRSDRDRSFDVQLGRARDDDDHEQQDDGGDADENLEDHGRTSFLRPVPVAAILVTCVRAV